MVVPRPSEDSLALGGGATAIFSQERPGPFLG